MAQPCFGLVHMVLGTAARVTHAHALLHKQKTVVLGRLQEPIEWVKTGLRAEVEHPFHVINTLSRYRKTRYLGLAKNPAQLFTLFGLVNFVLAGRRWRA